MKERIISELNLKSLEIKNENNWNEQTIIHRLDYLSGIINFPLAKLDDNMLNHIKTIIESIDSLDKTAMKYLEENCKINDKKDIWDIFQTIKRIKHDSVHLLYVIFYSDLTFRLKYWINDNCKEKICPKCYYIGFNFTKDLIMESVFSEIYPVHIKFDFTGYPVIFPLEKKVSFKATGIEGVIEEISVFNGKYQQSMDDNSTEHNIYARCPQNKSVCVKISLDKLHSHYKAYAEYAHKSIPVNLENVKLVCYEKNQYDDVGVFRTNNIYPIKWLKKHKQENSGIISILVKNKENFYINCEIQNYEIKKMEIIEDTNTCRKLEMDIYKEDIP